MTIPSERTRAVMYAKNFIVRVLVDESLPDELRERARRLLKHYPNIVDLKMASEKAPNVFGEPHESWVQSLEEISDELRSGNEKVIYQIVGKVERVFRLHHPHEPLPAWLQEWKDANGT